MIGPSISPRTLRNLRKELRGSLLAKLGILLVGVIVVAAMFAPLIAPYNPTDQNLNETQLPPLGFSGEEQVQTTETTEDGGVRIVNETKTINATSAHPLGTNNLGQDVLSRMIYGARTSLLVGLFGTGLAVIVGVTVGLIAGYFRGRLDDVLMRFADVSLAFPSLVLAIALVGLFSRFQADVAITITDPLVSTGLSAEVRSALGLAAAGSMPGQITLPTVVIIVVGVVNWVWFARIARGEALSIREEEFVKAARALGASDRRIVLRHVLPNAITPIIVLATIQVAAIILLESSLSFLGFSGTTLSWGFDISQGRAFVATSWWIAAAPGLAIMLTVIGINLIGDWLRDALDPGIEGEGGV